jgi:glutamate-5-semialdehyde dehydrogenase
VVDLLIPRGGEGLKWALKDVATVPVIFAAAGNCHVYVHSDADLEMARRIAVNAKTQRPGVCNAAETLLVDAAVAAVFLPAALTELREAGVELVGDERVRELAGEVEIGVASDEDWDTEYLDLKLAVAVVDSLDEAIEHVNVHGTGHSEAIVTSSQDASEGFTAGVDAAVVYTNASTRFTDGFEFGMGAEIGNSTQKLHARGPIGLRELTTYKYVVHGVVRHRRPRLGLQPAAPRPPRPRPGGALAARARGGDPRPDRRGAAQADRRRSRPRAAPGDDPPGRGRRLALLGLDPGGRARRAVLHV